MFWSCLDPSLLSITFHSMKPGQKMDLRPWGHILAQNTNGGKLGEMGRRVEKRGQSTRLPPPRKLSSPLVGLLQPSPKAQSCPPLIFRRVVLLSNCPPPLHSLQASVISVRHCSYKNDQQTVLHAHTSPTALWAHPA